MRRLSKTTWRRIAVYLGVSIAGLALFIAAYCLISGRTLIEALDSFWIALAIALATVLPVQYETSEKTRRPRQASRSSSSFSFGKFSSKAW